MNPPTVQKFVVGVLVLKLQLAWPKVTEVPEATLVNEPLEPDTVAFQDVTDVAVEAELESSVAVPPKLSCPVIKSPLTSQIFVRESVTIATSQSLKVFIFLSSNG